MDPTPPKVTTAALRSRILDAVRAGPLAPQPYCRVIASIDNGAQRQDVELTRMFLTASGYDEALAERLADLARVKLGALGFSAELIAGAEVTLQPEDSPPNPTPEQCRATADQNRWKSASAPSKELKGAYLRLAAAWDSLADWGGQP